MTVDESIELADATGTDAVASEDDDTGVDEQKPLVKSTSRAVTLGLCTGAACVVLLGGLSGYLGLRTYQSHRDALQRATFVAVGRQQALNLTTIDDVGIEGEVQRIVDLSTGTFRDDFQKRSPSFIDAVKQAKSKSVGTIVDAGLESVQGDEAHVLVAVSVVTTPPVTPDGQPRQWRMRLTVTRQSNEVKVSDVAFVP